MNETNRTFRITLQLSHFFQDHRSMCRIFINNEMKCVSDLQDHIHKIFNISNFYLISQGHYVPPTEDIRILQKDDIVVAIPNQYSYGNVAICTSTPLPRNIMGSTIEKKRKRQIDEEDVEGSKIHIEKKKKKKKKNLVAAYENEQKLTNSDFHHEENTHEYLEIDTIKSSKTEKKIKKLNISTNMQNLHSEELNQNESNNSVKNKILHFERQSHLDDVINCLGIQKQLCKSNKVNDANHSQNNHQIKELNDIVSKENGDKHQFKQKKLLIQRRGADIISYELPKKSNIVKSILISNRPLNTESCNLKSFKGNTAKGVDGTLKLDEQNNMQNGTGNTVEESNDRLVDNVEEALLNNEEISKPMTIPDNFVSNQIETKFVEISEKIKIDNDIAKQNFQEVKTVTDFSRIINTDNIKFNKIMYNSTSTDINKENIANMNENNQEIINNIQDKSFVTEKCLESNFVECLNSPCKTISIDSEITTQSNILEGDSISKNTNILSEAKSAVIQENLNYESRSQPNTFSDDVKCADAITFITKRKRKRSHRKRKSNVNLNNNNNNNSKSTEKNFIYSKQTSGSLATPVMHVKFDDNGEPIKTNMLQKSVCDFSVEISDKLINNSENAITNGCQSDEANNIQTTPEKVLDGNIDDPLTIDSDSTEEKGSKLPSVISEDVILKSPLMTLTKPKVGDLIAFKIFRLTEDYTPEVSKYIVGEILSTSNTTPDTVIKIIDGLDQCTEPDGKFFIEDEPKKLENIKSYCWTSLIEPRLIFP